MSWLAGDVFIDCFQVVMFVGDDGGRVLFIEVIYLGSYLI